VGPIVVPVVQDVPLSDVLYEKKPLNVTILVPSPAIPFNVADTGAVFSVQVNPSELTAMYPNVPNATNCELT
jgi:hypothetical protein